jgi:chemotaxis protein histidine kinase CheA
MTLPPLDPEPESSAGGDGNDDNPYLQNRVDELEQSRLDLEQQLYMMRSQRSMSVAGTEGDVTGLQRRLKEAEISEEDALRKHEARLREINDLESKLALMTQQQMQQQATSSASLAGAERLRGLEQELSRLKASEAMHRQKVEEQSRQIEEQSREIATSRRATVSSTMQRTPSQGSLSNISQAIFQSQSGAVSDKSYEAKLAASRQAIAESREEKEQHRRMSMEASAALAEHKAQSSMDQQDMEKTINEFKTLEDNYQRQIQEDRRTMTELQAQLESESRAKEQHMTVHAENAEQLEYLKGEVTYLKSVETYHKKQSDAHHREVQRLKRLREEDAPPPKEKRMPLKALEERIMHLACFMMLGICALPIMGAIAVLSDDNYVFWLGRGWPWMVIGGCTLVFVLFGVTMNGMFFWILPEHRSQFTMAFTWATFAALLGIILVPISLMANKNAIYVASTVSQGCMTALPRSELLVDYSQVLYNIRLSPGCANASSVTECDGFSQNMYTDYLAYLEQDFHCGPLCPEHPPPARAIKAPELTKYVPTLPPALPSPRVFGPPLQIHNAWNAFGDFLQDHASARKANKADKASSMAVQLRAEEAPRPGGVMKTALPHMQAKKLFSRGETRMTCYPLIATRLQVLVSTFGGLWYWEGMGLIIISLLTSLYAAMYFAIGKQEFQ